MTPPGRNAPCPCGSGLKYKKCCLAEGEARSAGVALGTGSVTGTFDFAAREAAAHPWGAGVFPLEVDAPEAHGRRTVVVLVTAGGAVLRADLENPASGEIEEVAGQIKGAVRAAARHHRVEPWAVRVTDRRVADALQARLAVDGVEVRAEPDLPDLLEAARDLNRHLVGIDVVPVFSRAPTWKRGWGLSRSTCEALFDAAAAFYRREPWRLLGDEGLVVTLPDSDWRAVVMGAAGVQRGLTIFSDETDYERVLAEDPAFEDAAGVMITLAFEDRDELPPPMRREIAAEKWTVVGRDAWPCLYSLNTPGGGIDTAAARDLTSILHAVVGFLDECADAVEAADDESILLWEDPGGGTRVEWLPAARTGSGAVAGGRPEQAGARFQGRAGEVAQRIADARSYDDAITEGVVALALELLDRYTLADPDGLARAHGPAPIAAGAVHSALLWRRTWGRAPSAKEVADWFGVSVGSVNARSVEIRRTVQAAGWSQDEIQLAAWQERGGPGAVREPADAGFLLRAMTRAAWGEGSESPGDERQLRLI